ncbi:hypothetical protein NM688_g3115 [Phlebia brevispora]|uniref:Uncharacterized protein n=1 Tax=Phlebia brevispora TaxID=194682 RepID=A0ACC1T6N8_9APHY|nr:hypothetical protein NM688_g3115 [Phlebia brevispora]
MSDAEDERIQDERPAKRFKHQSYKDTLKEVHITPAFAQPQFDYEIGDNDSRFHEALQHWRELNLAPVFLSFARRAENLAASMPLLVHHWKEVLELWLEAVGSADDEGLKALLDLFQKLTHDLRTTIAPLQSEVLSCLLKLLPRSLLAETLTTLLETFTNLFKYVTIPSDGMSDAWSSFASVLPRCDPEVQRVVAELWGSSLRRMKSAARQSCVTSIATSATPDVGAWCFVSACKSVSQTLHTVTPTIFAPLLRAYIGAEDPNPSFMVARRVLTALIHHCKGSEQFAPISDILVDELTKSTREDTEALRRLLEVIVVFSTLPMSDNLHAVLLKFAVSCLMAGDMALWMGPGRKVFERVWDERPGLALELTGALSDLNWGGWKLIAHPHVLKRTPTVIDIHPQNTLEMLSALQRSGRLGTMDAPWRMRLQAWIDDAFQEWNASEEQILYLHHIIELSDILPSLSAIIVNIVNKSIASANPTGDYSEHLTNSSWILGSCLKCLARRKPKEWLSSVDPSQWAEGIIKGWGWSGYALEGLVSLMEISAAQNRTIPFADVYDQLKESLLSHSRLRRLSALRVLTSQLNDVDGGTSEVLKRCLDGEEVSVDVQGVRERILRISRMNQIVRDDDRVAANIAARWLIAQLKVNLRPLWKPAGQALAALSTRFGDEVWDLLFMELQGGLSTATSEPIPHWMKMDDEEQDDIREDERTWRDPSAHKFRVAINKWIRGDMAHSALIKSQFVEERFDVSTYEIQLLAALAQCPALAEKHSRDLVPHFLNLAPPDSPTKLARHRLSAWLTLYSKFSNPKALRSTDDLQRIYMTLLCYPDRPLQRLALACILTYKAPSLVSRQDSLNGLLDDTRWRDELTQLGTAEIPVDERNDVVPVVIRLLFGLMLERHGRTRGADRRTAVLTALAGCTNDELCLLADLMLGPINKERGVLEGLAYTPRPIPDSVSDKQLVGFLNLLGDVVKNLGSRLLQRWPALLSTLLDTIGHAQSRIKSSGGDELEIAEEETGDHEDADTGDDHNASRTIRTVRQLGLKRFADFFRAPVEFNFDPYMRDAFRLFISPRLPLLDVESTQAPSALLELFHVWSVDVRYTKYLAAYDNSTLPKTYGCLVATNVKPSVISKVFDIIENLVGICSTDGDLLETVFKPHVSLLLENLALLVERSKTTASVTDPIARRQIGILSQLAPFMSDSAQATTLLNLFLPILRRPSNLVPEKIKLDILNIVKNLLPLVYDIRSADSVASSKLYSTLGFLFQNLRSRQARLALIATFHSLAELHEGLGRIADILDSLNAYSTKRLEEPDFDRRLTAFATLNEDLHSSLSAQEWLPILYNMLNFIQDPEEITIRNNASHAMKRFIDRTAGSGEEFESVFLKYLYPGIKNGLRSKNEPVRAEILGVLSYAISHCEAIGALQEMRGLLAAGDEEANFFNNVLHIQVHRRTRALRRLAEYCEEGKLRSSLLAEIFIPLLGNFITGDASVDHLVVNEAITTTGKIARHLQWGAYYALVQQYLRLIRKKDTAERLYVRTVVALLENFHFPMAEMVEDRGNQEANANEDGMEVDIVDSAEERKKTQISDAVNQRLLPSLLDHLEKREDNEDNLRIPIAIGVVRVALHLPQASKETQLTKLLTVLSQVFRSKSQDTRDLARETLCKIAIAIGPSYLSLIIRELRGALLRGPHLHVLAYVVHALLVHVTSEAHATTFSQLDDCVNDVAHVATEVIFGESGKDVQSEDFKTKMKEVRSSSSKGLDSFAIIAKYITPPKISSLLVPVRNILQQTETLKVMQQVEDLLRRIAGGLNANQHLNPKDLLVLCHTLVSQNAKFLKEVPKVPQNRGKGKHDTIVELKRHMVDVADHYSNNSFRYESPTSCI